MAEHHTPSPLLTARDSSLLHHLSEAIRPVAESIAIPIGADPLLTAMALGHAATTILFRAAPTPEMAQAAARIFADTSQQSMADMLAGRP